MTAWAFTVAVYFYSGVTLSETWSFPTEDACRMGHFVTTEAWAKRHEVRTFQLSKCAQENPA